MNVVARSPAVNPYQAATKVTSNCTFGNAACLAHSPRCNPGIANTCVLVVTRVPVWAPHWCGVVPTGALLLGVARVPLGPRKSSCAAARCRRRPRRQAGEGEADTVATAKQGGRSCLGALAPSMTMMMMMVVVVVVIVIEASEITVNRLQSHVTNVGEQGRGAGHRH